MTEEQYQEILKLRDAAIEEADDMDYFTGRADAIESVMIILDKPLPPRRD